MVRCAAGSGNAAAGGSPPATRPAARRPYERRAAVAPVAYSGQLVRMFPDGTLPRTSAACHLSVLSPGRS